MALALWILATMLVFVSMVPMMGGRTLFGSLLASPDGKKLFL